MKIAFVLGTRPEIIKMSPIIRLCHQRHIKYDIISTGQHYSQNMADIFFKELNIDLPKFNLRIGSGSHASQTGRMLTEIEKLLQKNKYDVVLVQGDTNSVLAGALAAAKLGIPVAHVEAGLRSYDNSMPEEINRIITDKISDYLFAPTNLAADILKNEGTDPSKISNTGNTIVEALDYALNAARTKKLTAPDRYFLLTLHRPANVDDPVVLDTIVSAISKVIEQYDTDILFPIHPRTRARLAEFGESVPRRLRLLEPLGYFEFVALEKSADLILTDSGGAQEEACILGVPCVTIRDNTERPETVHIGSNVLAGRTSNGIVSAVEQSLSKNKSWKQPYGNGKTSQKIINLICKI